MSSTQVNMLSINDNKNWFWNRFVIKIFQKKHSGFICVHFLMRAAGRNFRRSSDGGALLTLKNRYKSAKLII